MGVVVRAYSNMELVPDHGVGTGEWCEDDNHYLVFAYLGFGAAFDGLDETVRFPGKFIGGSCYQETTATECLEIMCTSYHGYGEWRDDLANAIYSVAPATIWNNPDYYRGKPFIEIIEFADNEGCIGPRAAGRLHAAFSDAVTKETFTAYAESRYSERPRMSTWLAEVWDGWVRGTALAADGGFIRYS